MSSWQSGPDSSSPTPRDSGGHSRRDFLEYSMAGGVALLGTGGLLTCALLANFDQWHDCRRHAEARRNAAPRWPGRSEQRQPRCAEPADQLRLPAHLRALRPAREPRLRRPASQLALAESITPNANATQWTIKVRPDVVCHNGKSFGAEDVLFSLRRIVNPKAPFPGSVCLTPLDLTNAKVVDR